MEDELCPLSIVGIGIQGIDNPFECYKEKCAWWNDEFEQCAIAALARVFTVPVADAERAGGTHPFDSAVKER